MKILIRRRDSAVDLRGHNRERGGVDWYSWSYLGGPDAGSAWLGAGSATIEDGYGLLRAQVQIFDESGERCWWGFVQAVRVGAYRVSLDQVWNRVGVEFEDGRLEWIEDAESVGRHGKREHLIRNQDSSASEAAILAPQFLREHAEPRVEILEAAALPGRMELDLLGWWHTLNWTYYTSALTQMTAIGGTGSWANFGTTTAQRIAQIYTIPAGNFSMVGRVHATVKAVGSPADDVIIRLRDCWGPAAIGDIVATAVVPAAQVNGTGVAVSPAFRNKVRVGASRSYFLEFDREDARNDANYYAIERGGSGTGYLTQGAGGLWSGPASGDLHLWLSGAEFANTSTLMGDIVTQAGQFLAGSEIELMSPSFNAYYDAWVRAGDLIADLIGRGDGLGSRLVARVAPRGAELVLRVTAQPAEAGLRLAGIGEVWHRELKLPAAQLGRFLGQWARLKDAPGRSVFIERGRYDARTGRVKVG